MLSRRLIPGILLAASLCAQVIEFEANGLKYQTLTKSGVTVMFAHMPSHVREFAILQVAISNGSKDAQAVRPEDFSYQRGDGSVIHAAPAGFVVNELIEKGNRNDVIRMVSTYEAGLYGLSRLRSTNGYEQRRQAALAEVSSTRLKAAAAASAIALVKARLKAGESTDGAVFFANVGRPLSGGRLVARTAGQSFEFNPD